MPGPRIGIDGVALASVWADPKDLGAATGLLYSALGTEVRQLRVSGLAVKIDHDGFTVECAPGLDVRAVYRHRTAGQDVFRDRCRSQPIGEPLRANARLTCLEDIADLHKQPLQARIGLGGGPTHDSESVPLDFGKGIKNPSHLDEVGLVVPVESIELTGDQETQEAEVAGTPDLVVDKGPKLLDDPRTFDQLAGQIELRTAGWSASGGVEGRTH